MDEDWRNAFGLMWPLGPWLGMLYIKSKVMNVVVQKFSPGGHVGLYGNMLFKARGYAVARYRLALVCFGEQVCTHYVIGNVIGEAYSFVQFDQNRYFFIE